MTPGLPKAPPGAHDTLRSETVQLSQPSALGSWCSRQNLREQHERHWPRSVNYIMMSNRKLGAYILVRDFVDTDLQIVHCFLCAEVAGAKNMLNSAGYKELLEFGGKG